MAKKNSITAAEDEEEDNDWTLACGAKMSSAKLTKIKDIVLKWKRSSKRTKVVIFSQCINFIRILAKMCEEERWGYRCLSGAIESQLVIRV
ncbi:hypothetical protein BDV10DRAFT_189697 [Aspergillus recurvatus]